MEVAKHPGLLRREGRYYVRVRVPLDLTKALGRKQIWKALRTADHREAVRRYFPARAELDRLFEQARRRSDANGRLTGDEARRLVSAWFQVTDRRAAEADFGLTGEDRSITLDETEQELYELVEGGDGWSVQEVVDRLLIAEGMPARAHTVGKIRTRRMVADVDPAETVELNQLVRGA